MGHPDVECCGASPTHGDGAAMNGAPSVVSARSLCERVTSHPSPGAAKDGAPGILGLVEGGLIADGGVG